jgi:hypothetical protein
VAAGGDGDPARLAQPGPARPGPARPGPTSPEQDGPACPAWPGSDNLRRDPIQPAGLKMEPTKSGPARIGSDRDCGERFPEGPGGPDRAWVGPRPARRLVRPRARSFWELARPS